MRLGFLADAHGNPSGLSACLARLREEGSDRIYFLGDAVGYLPGEAETLEWLRSASARCIRGNHEAMLLGELPIPERSEALYRLTDVRARLKSSDRAWIASWPKEIREEIDGQTFWFMHGSPADRLCGYVYPDGDFSSLDGLAHDLLVLANTHYPMVAKRGRTLILNPGSCGLPRDFGDRPSCAVYDTQTREARIIRLRMNPERVLARFDRSLIHPDVAACLFRSPRSRKAAAI